MKLPLSVLLLFAVSAFPQSKTTYTPDIDLAKAPADYRARVIQFRNILRKEPDRKAKVQKAISIAKTKNSVHRRDAIDFLGEVRAKEALPALHALAQDEEVRDEVIHALGDIGDLSSVSLLIRYLGDENENVRGNAQRALQKILKVSFTYNYSDPASERKNEIREIRTWWAHNQKTFHVRETTTEEKQSAEEAWDKYGKTYLHDLNR